MEIWKQIKGYEWLYEISNYWRVKSCSKIAFHRHWTTDQPERMMTPNDRWDWVMRVNLSKNKILKQFTVHRLVAIHFIRNPKKKRTVNHKDWDRTNNHVDNLEWMTDSENVKHSYDVLWRKHGMTWMTWYLHKRSKEVVQIDKTWKIIKRYWSLREAIKKTWATNIWNAIKKNIATKWYKWKYVDNN